MLSIPGAAEEFAERKECREGRIDVVLSVHTNGSVSVDYQLDRAASSLELPMLIGHSGNVFVQEGKGVLDNQGVVILPNPSNRIRMMLVAEPPVRRRTGVYPLVFAVEGRGVGIYLPYLLPEGCGEIAVRIEGGAGAAAVADGAYRRLEHEYRISDVGGFVLLGDDLTPDSIVQLPKSLPPWLGRAIRDSYRKAQTELVGILGGHRIQVPVFVDFSTAGGGKRGTNGGDAARNTIRLWFRGDAWAQEEAVLRERMNDVLVHELVHCHQVPETWEPWAHEGHARFIELLVAARRNGEPSSRIRAEKRLSQDFDRCMNDLRVGESRIDPYACGAVAYWLRWLETGQVNMLAEEDVEYLVEKRTVVGRFLRRASTEADVVAFVRSTGFAVDVTERQKESSHSVRTRMLMTLLRHECGAKRPLGFWTNERSVTLDAPDCPQLDGFELQTIAGHNVIGNVHLGYAALTNSCGQEGRVAATGIDGARKWIKCDRSFQWPSTTRSQYRLIAPLEAALARSM